MQSPPPLALQAGEGAFMCFAGIRLFIKAGSADTHGQAGAFNAKNVRKGWHWLFDQLPR